MTKPAYKLPGLLLGILLNLSLFAQPANDDCGGAFNVVISDSEENVILTEGDTRGATKSLVPGTQFCSSTFYSDDIFFKFNTPAFPQEPGFIIRAYFNNALNITDVPAVGMALYDNCDSNAIAIFCLNADQEKNSIEISTQCLLLDHTYYIRVWSYGDDSTTEGTLGIGIYPSKDPEPFLWEETFAGGLLLNGWTTYGTCANPDSNINGVFLDLPNGLIDRGLYVTVGTKVASSTFCDGAVGVDSDYNDTGGIIDFGWFHCPTPGTKNLISPVIYSGGWDVSGISLTWTQAIRNYGSTFFISYRSRDIGSEWTNWIDIEINKEFPLNGPIVEYDIQRHFLPGAAGYDSLQLRFIYNDNYYFWAIDDIKLVETECNNLEVDQDSIAIAPWVQLPSDQVPMFAGMADIFNKGACQQTDVKLNLRIRDITTGDIVYDEVIDYNTIDPYINVSRQLFDPLIDLPEYPASYRGTYTVFSDSLDFDSRDDTVQFFFNVGGDVFAHEDGYTTAITNPSYYTVFEHIPAYAYGNIFTPEEDVNVNRIIWGPGRTEDLAGKFVNLLLIQWTDIDDNLIAESHERHIIAHSEYVFTGDESFDILESYLENFNDPGSPILIKGGQHYMAVVEYAAPLLNDPPLYLQANDSRDFTTQVIAIDSAYERGWTDSRLFMSVLGYSPDNVINNIDYQVRDLFNDYRLHWGDHIVPVIRIGTSAMNTEDNLPSNNLITVYPNPAKDELMVNMSLLTTEKEIRIHLINQLGQIVYVETIADLSLHQNHSIDVSSFPPGNYTLSVYTLQNVFVKPFAILR